MVPEASSLTSDVRRVFELFLAERRNVGICLGLALATALIYNRSFQPVYQSDAIVSVYERLTGSPAGFSDKNRNAAVTASQYALLTSPEFASRVFEVLGEPEKSELNRGSLASWLAMARAEWRRRFQEARPLSADEALSALRSRLTIVPLPDTTWISIRLRAFDPETAASLANLVVRELVAANEQNNETQAVNAATEVDRLVSAGKQKLGQRIDDVRALGKEKGYGDLETRRQMLEQQARGFTEALIAAETTRLGRAATLREAARSGSEALHSVSDPQLMAAEARVAELEEEERGLLVSLGERHPDALAVREKLAVARARAARLMESFQKSADAQYRLALEEENRLREQVSRVRAEIAALDANSVDYALSKKKVEAATASVGSIIYAGQAKADTVVEVRLIQAARPSRTAVEPNPERTYMLAVVVGLLGAAFFVFGREQLSGAVRLPEDLARISGLRVLGGVPKVNGLRTNTINEALDRAEDGFRDSLRTVRTNLVYLPSAAERLKVIVVTSASPHDGKSTTAAALAILMKEISERVLLVDGDLRRPTAHLALNVPQTPGLSDALKAASGGTLTPTPTQTPGLDILTAGTTDDRSSALLGSDQMARLLKQARERYDWVIVDSPPALALPDASVLAVQSDGALIVCSSETTRLREIQEVVSRLEAVGGRILGAVLNQVDMKRHSYYYGRSYSSYYGAAKAGAKKQAA